MTISEKTIPYHLIGMHDGDVVVGFQLAAGQVIFQVASMKVGTTTSTETPAPRPSKKISDWIDKWAGTLVFEPGETRESVRAAAMQERFGL
jgi:hypothetical protein